MTLQLPLLPGPVAPRPRRQTGRERRDKALARVMEHTGETWQQRAARAAERLAPGDYTGEDIRAAITRTAGEPHHHNCWGALIMALVRSGLLTPTGKHQAMTRPTSHARKNPVYRKEDRA